MAPDDTRDLENPLGIAQEPIVQKPEDRLPDSGPAGARRRRARALGEDGADSASGLGDTDPDSHGATAIDMGAGGHGNNVKPGG